MFLGEWHFVVYNTVYVTYSSGMYFPFLIISQSKVVFHGFTLLLFHQILKISLFTLCCHVVQEQTPGVSKLNNRQASSFASLFWNLSVAMVPKKLSAFWKITELRYPGLYLLVSLQSCCRSKRSGQTVNFRHTPRYIPLVMYLVTFINFHFLQALKAFHDWCSPSCWRNRRFDHCSL